MNNNQPVIAVYTRSGYPQQNVIDSIANYKNTYVNTLLISGPNGNGSQIVYNEPEYVMFNSDGMYVGCSSWINSLKELISKTNIEADRIFLSLGNSAISTLGTMSSDAIARVMTWLKNNGISGIDMDDESWGQPGGLAPMDDPCKTVTLASIAAGLNLTASPYNRLNEWQDWIEFVRENKGTLLWLNVQCYAGGAGNDPVKDWFLPLNSEIPIVAGFEAKPGTDSGALSPCEAAQQIKQWQNETPKNSLFGAFVWQYFFIHDNIYSVKEYATSIYEGLRDSN